MTEETGLSKREKFLLIQEYRDALTSEELSAVEVLAELYEQGFSQKEAHEILERVMHTEDLQNILDAEQDNYDQSSAVFCRVYIETSLG